MKKLLLAMFICALVCSACSSGTEQKSDTTSGITQKQDTEPVDDHAWGEQDELKQIASESIEMIRYSTATEDGYRDGETADEETIREIRELICGLSLGKPTDMSVTDADMNITIISDDKELSYFFEDDILVLEQGRYEVDDIAALRRCIEALLSDD